MKVTFTRTHTRGYSVSIEGAGIEPAAMNPAPGYDDRLPHDAGHFIVENELGIVGGIFGQLAAGGTANTFYSKTAKRPRKAKKRGGEMVKENKKDLLFSEHAVYAAQARWERQDIIPDTKIAAVDIDRICSKFEEFAEKWQALEVGESMTLEWHHNARPKR